MPPLLGSPAAPLLPLATPPGTPGPPPPPLHRHPTRRAVRRLLLLVGLVLVLLHARWGTRAMLRIWRGGSLDASGDEGGWEALRAGGGPERSPATGSAAAAAGAHAASAADNAVTAALDAGAALKDTAGAVKHTAVAAGQAVGAAASLAAPLAQKAAQAAGSVGSAAKSAVAELASAATEAAASDIAHTAVAASAAGNQTGAGATKAVAGPAPKQAPREGPQRPRPPAELPPPVVAPASNDTCGQVGTAGTGHWAGREGEGWPAREPERPAEGRRASPSQSAFCVHGDACLQPSIASPQALGLPKVALLFLTKGPMPHEPAWRLWFASAAGLLPARQAEVRRRRAGLAVAGLPHAMDEGQRATALVVLMRAGGAGQQGRQGEGQQPR